MRALALVTLTIFLVTLGMALEGGHPSALYQPSALLIVFGPLVGYLFIAIGPKELAALWARLSERKLHEEDRHVLERISALGFLFGCVSVIIGFIHVFQNLADTSRLGAGVAVALVGLVYGAIPAIVVHLLTGISVKAPKKEMSYLGTTLTVAFFLFGTVMFLLSQSA